jgi:regulator of sigma E protease
MDGIYSFLAFIVLIGVMINFHELGHYWAARYFDIKIEAFSFGFGPRIWGWRRGETEFKISAIPFGGYVKMSGEQPGDEQTGDPRAFTAKPRWQRLIVAFAGPFMNMVLAVAVMAGVYMVKFPKESETQPGLVSRVQADSSAAKAGVKEGDQIISIAGIVNPSWDDITAKVIVNPEQPLALTVFRAGQKVDLTLIPKRAKMGTAELGDAGWDGPREIVVNQVSPGMPAERTGLRAGDLLLSANGQPLRSAAGLQEILKVTEGKPVALRFSRDGAEQSLVVQPEMKDDPSGNGRRYMIGVTMEQKVTYVQLGLVSAVTESVKANVRNATMIFDILRGLVMQRLSPKMLEGPIRIAQLSGDAARMGVLEYLMLMAGVSLNLAVFNLLPIPILDGGMILVLLFEMLIRRDLSLKFKETVLKLGFVFLMVIVVFVLYNDISKLIPG